MPHLRMASRTASLLAQLQALSGATATQCHAGQLGRACGLRGTSRAGFATQSHAAAEAAAVAAAQPEPSTSGQSSGVAVEGLRRKLAQGWDGSGSWPHTPNVRP